MSRSVSREFSWVLSACLFATVSSAFAQDSQPPAAAQPPAQTAQPAQTPPPVQPAPAARPTVQAAPPEAPRAAQYDNTYEISGGLAYAHLDASPPVPGSGNLGGFNIIGTRWFTGRLGAAASVRGYYGTTPTVANKFGVESPYINQYLFLGGPELRGPHSRDVAVDFHALFGAARGTFDSALKGIPPSILGILSNQTVFASALGGSLDINRSPRLAYRLTPEVLITRYDASPSSSTQFNFGFTAGILYRFE